MRTLLLTILGCLAFTAGHAGAAQNPAPETAGAQQDAKARGAHLRMEVAGHDFGDVRVHDDAAAAASARGVQALAYTVGTLFYALKKVKMILRLCPERFLHGNGGQSCSRYRCLNSEEVSREQLL